MGIWRRNIPLSLNLLVRKFHDRLYLEEYERERASNIFPINWHKPVLHLITFADDSVVKLRLSLGVFTSLGSLI